MCGGGERERERERERVSNLPVGLIDAVVTAPLLFASVHKHMPSHLCPVLAYIGTLGALHHVDVAVADGDHVVVLVTGVARRPGDSGNGHHRHLGAVHAYAVVEGDLVCRRV